jgi:hypothetical protein
MYLFAAKIFRTKAAENNGAHNDTEVTGRTGIVTLVSMQTAAVHGVQKFVHLYTHVAALLQCCARFRAKMR